MESKPNLDWLDLELVVLILSEIAKDAAAAVNVRIEAVKLLGVFCGWYPPIASDLEINSELSERILTVLTNSGTRSH